MSCCDQWVLRYFCPVGFTPTSGHTSSQAFRDVTCPVNFYFVVMVGKPPYFGKSVLCSGQLSSISVRLRIWQVRVTFTQRLLSSDYTTLQFLTG